MQYITLQEKVGEVKAANIKNICLAAFPRDKKKKPD